MNSESVQPQNPSIPEGKVALAHVYWTHPRNSNKSDTRGHAQVIASEMLFKSGEISDVVITGGRINGDNPGLAGVMAQELKRRSKIPEKNIHVYPQPEGGAKSTIEEIALFKEFLNQNGLQNNPIASIANREHIAEIRDELKYLFGENDKEIPVFETEKVIVETNPRFAPVIERGFQSQSEHSLKKQQQVKMMVRKIPGGRTLLKNVARLLPNKAELQQKILSMVGKK